MRKDFGARPWLYPQPVLVIGTYDAAGRPNAMCAAWGGISDDTELSVCVAAEHKSAANFAVCGAFTVSMATERYLAECDYLGVVSGNDEPDKLAACGLHAVKAPYVNAPLIAELPMAVECRLVSYDPDSCRLVGEIVNVCADESILDEKGEIDPDRLRPVSFDPVHSTYRALGGVVADAFIAGTKI